MSLDTAVSLPISNDMDRIKRRRRAKPSKKRNCPAYMYIREVVLFPQFSISADKCLSSKHVVRKEKATLINKLKVAMVSGHLETLHRFFLHIPLPEAHADHPTNAGMAPMRPIDPFVRGKIDELLATGTYEVRHIQLIVHDYVNETLLKNEIAGFQSEPLLFPTEQEINDYIYLTNLTGVSEIESTENEKFLKSALQSEMTKSVHELMSLIHNCSDEDALNKAKTEMTKIICRVKRSTAKGVAPRDKLAFPTKQTAKVSGTNEMQEPESLQNTNVTCQTTELLMHQQPTNEELDSTLLLPSINITQHDMLPTFSRLMESSDPVMMTGLDDRLMGQNSDFHHGSLGHTIMHELRTPHQSFLK